MADRHETDDERADRNWEDLLQELRVTQTGIQLLSGFLLILPFQSRFEDLDAFQVDWYLGLLLLALVIVALLLTPVGMHRRLFRQRVKDDMGRETTEWENQYLGASGGPEGVMVWSDQPCYIEVGEGAVATTASTPIPAYTPIPGDEAEILGKVVAVLRRV